MAAHATLIVAGRVDEATERERIEKLLLIGLVNSLGEEAPALDAQFGHLASAFPTPTASGEFGLCISNASTTSTVTNHLIRVQFNPTAEQFRTALREAFIYALNTGRTSESEPSVDGRVHVVYTGQVMAHTGDWLLADSAVAGHQIHSWLDSQAAMSWWPQLDKYPNVGDKLHVHLVIPIAGPGTSWAVDKPGHPQSILTHVDVRLVQLSLTIEASWRSGGKPVANNPADTESYDGIRSFVQQVIQHHPSTILALDSDDPALGCALSAQRPALYVFPGAGLTTQGCGLFSLQGFTMLLGGAYTAQSAPNWWPMVRNLPKLDAVLLPDWSAANLLTHQFMAKLVENGLEGSRIIGELLLPPSGANPSAANASTESSNDLALSPPTGKHLGLNHSPWAPQNLASESLPPSTVLYSKLGWGELRLQPLAQRAGLVLLWKSTSHQANPATPLRIVLPTTQLHGASPVQGLIRLLKSLNTVPQLEMKTSGTTGVGSTMMKSSTKSTSAASRASTNHSAARLNGSAHPKPQVAPPRPQTAPRPATAKPSTTAATKKSAASAHTPASSSAPPKRTITATAAPTTAAAPKRPASSAPATKEPASRPSKPSPAAPTRPSAPSKFSSARPTIDSSKPLGTTASGTTAKPSPPKPKAPTTADRLAAHANLVASKQPSAKSTTAATKSKSSTAPPPKKPATPVTGKLATKAKSPIREEAEPSPAAPVPTIEEKKVEVAPTEEPVVHDPLRESLELAAADPLMSGWRSLEQSDVASTTIANSQQQQQQQPSPMVPYDVSAEPEMPHTQDLYKVHKFEGFNEADEADLMEGARTPSSLDQEPEDVVQDHTLGPQESVLPAGDEQDEAVLKSSNAQFTSPIELEESKVGEYQSEAEPMDRPPLSNVSEHVDFMVQGGSEIAPPFTSPMGVDQAMEEHQVPMPGIHAQQSNGSAVPLSCTPALLGHEAEVEEVEEENVEPEPTTEESQSRKGFSPIPGSPGYPVFTEAGLSGHIRVGHEAEAVTHALLDHHEPEATLLGFHESQQQETNDLSDTGSFERHEEAAAAATRGFEPDSELISPVQYKPAMLSSPMQMPLEQQPQSDYSYTDHAQDWIQHSSGGEVAEDPSHVSNELSPTERLDPEVARENVAFISGELSQSGAPSGFYQQEYEPTNEAEVPVSHDEGVHPPVDHPSTQEPVELSMHAESQGHSVRDQWYHSTGLLDDTAEDEPLDHDELDQQQPQKVYPDLTISGTAHSGFGADLPADDLLVHATSGLPLEHAPHTACDTEMEEQESSQWSEPQTKEVAPDVQPSTMFDDDEGAVQHAADDAHLSSSVPEPDGKPADPHAAVVPEQQAWSHFAPGPMGDVAGAEDEAFAVHTESHKQLEPEHFVENDVHLRHEQPFESTDMELRGAADETELQEHPEATSGLHSEMVHASQADASSDVEADGVSTTVHQSWSYEPRQLETEDDQSIEAQMRLKMQQEAAQWSAGLESNHYPTKQEPHHHQQCEQSSDVSDAEINDTEIVVSHIRTTAQPFHSSVESPLSSPAMGVTGSTPWSESAHAHEEERDVEDSAVLPHGEEESFPNADVAPSHVVSSGLDLQTHPVTGLTDSLDEAVDSAHSVHDFADSELLVADSTTTLPDSAVPTSTQDQKQHDAQPVTAEHTMPDQLDQQDAQAFADSTTTESSHAMIDEHNELSTYANAPAPIGFDRLITGYKPDVGESEEHPVNVGSPDSQASVDSMVRQQQQQHAEFDDMKHTMASEHHEQLTAEGYPHEHDIDSHDAHITSTQPLPDAADGEAEAFGDEHTPDMAPGLEGHGAIGFQGYDQQISENGTAHGSLPPLPSRGDSEDHNTTSGVETNHVPGSLVPGHYANGNAHTEDQHEQPEPHHHGTNDGEFSSVDRLKMLHTDHAAGFEGHPETTWSPSDEAWPHKPSVRPDQFSPDSFGDDDTHQDAPYPKHGIDFLSHATGTNPFEVAGSPGHFGHPTDASPHQTNHPGQSPLVSPQPDGFDPLQGWTQPQGLPAPTLPATASRGARTTNPPARPAPPSRSATASSTASRGKPTSTASSGPAAPATLPPGAPVYMDLIWVPGYLTRVPQSMIVEFFTRVRAHTYVLSGDALHPMIGEALIEAKAKWSPNDVEILCKHSGTETHENTICILPTDEPYEWNCWLRTPCGRISRESGEARLEACGFKVLPSASCCDIEFSAGAVNVRCEGVRVEF